MMTIFGPRARIARAARTMLCSCASCRASPSLTMRTSVRARTSECGTLALDKVHRVERHQPRLRDDRAPRPEAEDGYSRGDEFAVAIVRWQLWFEVREDVELGVERDRLIEVFAVAPRPKKVFAQGHARALRDRSDASRACANAPPGKSPPTTATRRTSVKVACRHREVRRAAAEGIRTLSRVFPRSRSPSIHDENAHCQTSKRMRSRVYARAVSGRSREPVDWRQALVDGRRNVLPRGHDARSSGRRTERTAP